MFAKRLEPLLEKWIESLQSKHTYLQPQVSVDVRGRKREKKRDRERQERERDREREGERNKIWFLIY